MSTPLLKAIEAYSFARKVDTVEAYEVAADALEEAGELETAGTTRLIADCVRSTKEAESRLATPSGPCTTRAEGK